MTFFNAKLAEVVRKDGRFAYEAYEFVFQALNFTQKMLGREPPQEMPGEEAAGEARHHVSGKELLEGIRLLALREFGLMARSVLRLWGIQRTDDFGTIVFNLIDSGLLSKTNEDALHDFHEVYDLDQALREGYQIQVDEAR